MSSTPPPPAEYYKDFLNCQLVAMSTSSCTRDAAPASSVTSGSTQALLRSYSTFIAAEQSPDAVRPGAMLLRSSPAPPRMWPLLLALCYAPPPQPWQLQLPQPWSFPQFPEGLPSLRTQGFIPLVPHAVALMMMKVSIMSVPQALVLMELVPLPTSSSQVTFLVPYTVVAASFSIPGFVPCVFCCGVCVLHVLIFN